MIFCVTPENRAIENREYIRCTWYLGAHIRKTSPHRDLEFLQITHYLLYLPHIVRSKIDVSDLICAPCAPKYHVYLICSLSSCDCDELKKVFFFEELFDLKIYGTNRMIRAINLLFFWVGN
jgi:hypothetical protein